MTLTIQVFYSIFSGVIMALAIPNEVYLLGSPLLGIIALIPLFVGISSASSYKKSGFLTALQILVTHLLSSYWLGKFKDFAIFTLGASGLAYFAFGYGFGQFLYLPFAHYNGKNKLKAFSYKSSSIPAQQILYFATVWTLYEGWKSTGFLAYPWGTLVMSSYRWSLLTQIASVTGTWGISFMFALFSAVIGKGLLLIPEASKYKYNKAPVKTYAQTASLCMVLLAGSVFFGAGVYLKNVQPVKTMKVSMVQHNSEPWVTFQRDVIAASMEETEKALAEYKENEETPDLVVWNESSLGFTFPRAMDTYTYYPEDNPLIPFIKKCNVPFIMGAPYYLEEKQNSSNAAVFFDKDGNFIDHYGKIHLVPFAEYIPYADNPLVKKFMSSVVGFSNGWAPGLEYKLFNLDLGDGESVKFTTPICFEDAFADLCRDLYKLGSEVFVNITNDSWSETNSAEYQHFVVASFRTIEHRTSMLRSCTSGYTCVIDRMGRVIADIPLFEQSHLNTEVPVYERTKTTYTRFGNWVIYVLFVLQIAYWIYMCKTYTINWYKKIRIEKKEMKLLKKQKSLIEKQDDLIIRQFRLIKKQQAMLNRQNNLIDNKLEITKRIESGEGK